MRIAIVSHEVIPFFGAGIGTYAAQSARAWRNADHEVVFLSTDHKGFAARGSAELGGAECRIIQPTGTGPAFARHATGVRHELLRLHAANPIDYIEFPDYGAEGYFAIRGRHSAGELAGAVLGIRLHTPTLECRLLNEERSGNAEIDALERCEDAAIRSADAVISPSRSLLAIVKDRLAFTAPSFVVPYPFEITRTPEGTRPDAAVILAPLVLYIGRLERRKGVELLVDAGLRMLERGAEVRFRFIGGDTLTGPRGTSMLAHLRSRIPDRWNDRFGFDARKPRAELFSIIRGISAAGGVCCFPSLWENFPNVCLEAMSLSAAVVGSDAGGMSEIIEDGLCGILFNSGDAASLDAALSRTLADQSLRERVSIAAPARIATLCDPSAIIRQMTQAIDTTRRSPSFGQRRPFNEVHLPSSAAPTLVKRLAARWLK